MAIAFLRQAVTGSTIMVALAIVIVKAACEAFIIANVTVVSARAGRCSIIDAATASVTGVRKEQSAVRARLCLADGA